jgi:hypothetical protein
MLRNIRGFSIASLRAAVRPRFPSRTVVPLVATGTFAAVAANHFLVSGCHAQCLEETRGESSPVTREISPVEHPVKKKDLESLTEIYGILAAIENKVNEMFPDDAQLRITFRETTTDSKSFLLTLKGVYVKQVLLSKHAELKSKLEDMKHQYPAAAAAAAATVSDMKDTEDGGAKAELRDHTEGDHDKSNPRKQLPLIQLPGGVRSA